MKMISWSISMKVMLLSLDLNLQPLNLQSDMLLAVLWSLQTDGYAPGLMTDF